MSKTRILKNGGVVDELNKSVMLVIKTKAPTKYKLIDQEISLKDMVSKVLTIG